MAGQMCNLVYGDRKIRCTHGMPLQPEYNAPLTQVI